MSPVFGATRFRAFTLVEVLAIIFVLFGLAAVLTPGLARTRKDNLAARCLNNHRQLIQSWTMYATDNQNNLVAANNGTGRPMWMTGDVYIGFPATLSHVDYQRDIAVSPLWSYTAKEPLIFRCPSDQSSIVFSGTRRPRVRSISMSPAFGTGEWLNSSGGTFSGVGPFRTYQKLSDVRIPSKTFVFADEHPDSINDGVIAVACNGSWVTDPQNAGEWIIDYPASFHDGACSFSFADGHTELHKWVGNKIKAPASYGAVVLPSGQAGDSWRDIRWLAENTTVKR